MNLDDINKLSHVIYECKYYVELINDILEKHYTAIIAML